LPSMPSYEHYVGELFSIPPSATPGLQFLKDYLPLLDENDGCVFDTHVSPTATLTSNGGQPIVLKDIAHMFAQRSARLSEFTHTAHPVEAWDMEGRWPGKRQVIFHSISR
jgi:hypothetical protein